MPSFFEDSHFKKIGYAFLQLKFDGVPPPLFISSVNVEDFIGVSFVHYVWRFSLDFHRRSAEELNLWCITFSSTTQTTLGGPWRFNSCGCCYLLAAAVSTKRSLSRCRWACLTVEWWDGPSAARLFPSDSYLQFSTIVIGVAGVRISINIINITAAICNSRCRRRIACSPKRSRTGRDVAFHWEIHGPAAAVMQGVGWLKPRRRSTDELGKLYTGKKSSNPSKPSDVWR